MNEKKLEILKARVFSDYEKRRPKSKIMYERACKTLQTGVGSSLKYMYPFPFYSTHGKGAKLYDVDGNEYIDCFLNSGPLLLGHCNPEIMEALRLEMDRGLMVQNPDLSVECAELIKEMVPCAERVRFVNTGVEATIYAVRVAKAYTGKNKILKFYGHYHGMDDQFLKGNTSISDDPVGAGVPVKHIENTVMARHNDISDVKRLLDEDADIAGIILDAQGTSGGIWPATREFLQELRKITKEKGIVLIFDEVVTGFRLAPGGAQEYFGVIPDLTTLAKGMGAGAKIGAIVGSKELMKMLTPGGYAGVVDGKKIAMHGGTYIDGVQSMVAAIAAMKIYKKFGSDGEYQQLFQRALKLKHGIENAFEKREIPINVNCFGPSLKMFQTSLSPSFETYGKVDKTLQNLVIMGMMNEGTWLTHPNGQTIYLSFAHTDKDIDDVINALEISMDKYDIQDIYSS